MIMGINTILGDSSTHQKLDAAIKFIAPRSTTTEVWNNEGSAPKSNTTSADAGNLHTVLAAISNMNSSRAANAIIRLLENTKCSTIKERVEAVITKTTKDLSIMVTSKISGGLFSLNNLYIPINHKNIHWLTLRIDLAAKKISLWDSQGEKMENAQYTNTALRYLGDEYTNAYPNRNVLEWMRGWTIEDLSDECPQQANGFDCGIFTLLNLSLLVEEGSITRDSYSQESIDAKEVRKVIAHMLWEASSNKPEV